MLPLEGGLTVQCSGRASQRLCHQHRPCAPLIAALDAFLPHSIRRIFRFMGLTFEWDEAKASENLRKHGVSFAEASTVFADPLSRTIPDPLHSDEEDRFVVLGESASGHTLVVVHTHWGENIRIISARRATPRERKDYERGTE